MPSFQRKYNTYRLTFPEFVYDSYRYDVQPEGLHISFRFLLGDKIVFTPLRLSLRAPSCASTFPVVRWTPMSSPSG